MSTFRIWRGDALQWLQTLETDSVDAVITDPPYSSGGFVRGDRMADPSDKYVQSGTEIIRESFAGDNRDARSFLFWCALWISECWRVLKPGGYFMMFSDWRQLPLATDAMQAGNLVWRGLIAWDKGPAARAPHKGYFRHQAEYIVWGSKGGLPIAEHDGPYPGVIQCQVNLSDKHHITGKPTSVMKILARPVKPGGLIIDPFMGSGTTGVAALDMGRRFAGCELSEHYFEVAKRRLERAAAQPGLGTSEERGRTMAMKL